MQVSEDSQPNELRLSDKGRNTVPVIRTSRPFDHRGGKAARTGGPAQSGATATGWYPRAPNPTFNSKKRPYHDTISRQPRRLADNSQGRAPAHRDPTVSRERPPKKPRTDTSPRNPRGDHDTLGSRNRGGNTRSEARTTVPRLTISVPMPPDCLSGAPRCTHRRRGWLKAKKRELEHERGVTIVNQSFQGPNVTFDCRSTRAGGTQATCEPKYTEVPSLPLPRVKETLGEPSTKCMLPEVKAQSLSRIRFPGTGKDHHCDTEVCACDIWFSSPSKTFVSVHILLLHSTLITSPPSRQWMIRRVP